MLWNSGFTPMSCDESETPESCCCVGVVGALPATVLVSLWADSLIVAWVELELDDVGFVIVEKKWTKVH